MVKDESEKEGQEGDNTEMSRIKGGRFQQKRR